MEAILIYAVYGDDIGLLLVGFGKIEETDLEVLIHDGILEVLVIGVIAYSPLDFRSSWRPRITGHTEPVRPLELGK
jgi:hypothetical protein